MSGDQRHAFVVGVEQATNRIVLRIVLERAELKIPLVFHEYGIPNMSTVEDLADAFEQIALGLRRSSAHCDAGDALRERERAERKPT